MAKFCKNIMFSLGVLVFLGCSTTLETRSRIQPFRHTVLYTPLRNQSPDSKHVAWNFDSFRKVSHVQCIRGFRNPALNRCEIWAPYDKFDFAHYQAELVIQARSMMRTSCYPTPMGQTTLQKDCAQFVMDIFAGSQMPLKPFLPSRISNEGDVSLLYRMAYNHNMLHQNKIPLVGDLVFFDNTYDRNSNRLFDDPLTHVGIVESVDPNGTITFIHRVQQCALRQKMNLFMPHNHRHSKTKKVLNHYLRVRTSTNGQKLTGELFSSFATVVG